MQRFYQELLHIFYLYVIVVLYFSLYLLYSFVFSYMFSYLIRPQTDAQSYYHYLSLFYHKTLKKGFFEDLKV